MLCATMSIESAPVDDISSSMTPSKRWTFDARAAE